MSEKSQSSGISRRSFVKTAGFAAGITGLVGAAGMTSVQEWFAPVTASAEDEEYIAYTFHQYHCGGMCPLKCTVRGGRLVLVEPNRCTDDRYETICLKGISEVQHIYGSGRAQVPLRRIGERGENKFEQISWDEALDEIVNAIKEIQQQHGKNSVLVTLADEAGAYTGNMLQAILGAQGRGKTGIDVGYGNGFDPAIGLGGGYATSSAEARDWVDSKLVLTVGSNFCESSLPNARAFFEAKEAGARMVTVDPHFSTTACKSDEWVPIEPGTDPALFLGMVSHILNQKLYDEAFMKAHTAFPFLVDIETGKLVRDHEPQMVTGKDGKEVPEDGIADPYFVIDETTGEVVAYQSTNSAALSGTTIYEGREVCTVFDLLVDKQKPYTTEWASQVTTIPAHKIEELAEQYASGPSALALGWGGGDKMSNADVAGHACAIMVALTGNIGRPGAAAGVFVGGAFGSGYAAKFGAWKLPEQYVAAKQEMASYDMRTKQNSVRAVISFGDDLAQHYGNMGKSEEWYRSLDLVVMLDPYYTESCKWADYVLPLTTRFENDADYGDVRTGYNNIVMQNKVIDPLFEAKTDFWVQREICKRLGCADILPSSPEEFVNRKLSDSEDPYVSRLTPETINNFNGVYPCEGIEEPKRNFVDYKFLTSSKRMDVYYENMLPYGQELPAWVPCSEATNDNPLREKYPLQLANVRTRFHIHNQFNDSVWMQELYTSTVDMNPIDMKARGLSTGDAVTIRNDRGSVKVRIHGNEAIRPGSARLYEGATSDFTLEGNMQSLTNDATEARGYDQLAGPVTPFSDTLVEVQQA